MFLVATRNFPPEVGGMQNLMEGLSNALLNHGPVKVFAEMNNFGEVNYLFDETQEIAKKYGAVCTPDFFGYNKNLELQYRGRFRELKELKPINNGDSDLKVAMKIVARTNKGPEKQIPSMGCNIKWFN